MKADPILAQQIVSARPAEVAARSDGGRWTLIFVREFAHSPARLWGALTDPEVLRQWAPFVADRDLGATGPVVLTMTDGDEPLDLDAMVTVAQRGVVLEYTWGEDLLRWELTQIVTGTRLKLEHTVAGRDLLPQVAAGWHICLFVADRVLDGDPVPRIVGTAAMEYGWAGLRESYATALGLAQSDHRS